MKLSVIIPVYNEDDTFIDLLRRVAAVSVDKEILVVDDGSENCVEPLVNQAAVPGVRLYVHPQNQGKGAAIRTALKHVMGEIVIIQDADTEYYPEDYIHLLEIYDENQAQAVYGVRDLSDRSVMMEWGNYFVTWATNVLYGSRLKDMETCYKMIDRRLMQSLDLQSDRFEIEAEISAKLIRAQIPIVQTPIRYTHRHEGKKLKATDGWPAILTLLRYRFWSPQTGSLNARASK